MPIPDELKGVCNMDGLLRRGCLLLLAVLVVTAPGCSRKPKPVVVPPPVSQTKPPETKPAEPVKTVETPAQSALDLKDIFFDYDRYNLRDDARATLNDNAKVISANPAAAVTLEGHCDERGTVEYNLALGERRANAARSYLVQYGIDPGRLTTISYGKERPFDPGHDDAAWVQNRRVHLVKR
jgi:peptidoglycan-associated lipoprotein